MKCWLMKLEVEEQRQDVKAAPLKTDHSYAVLPICSFLVSADVLRYRKKRGWRPRPEEYDGLVTDGRYGTPVREGALCRAFNLAKEAARAEDAALKRVRDAVSV